MGFYFDFFDYSGFRNIYLNSSTYKNKEKLFNDFHRVFYNITNYSLSQHGVHNVIVSYWKDPKVKSQIKAQLEGKGHTRSAINGICKAFEKTLSYTV